MGTAGLGQEDIALQGHLGLLLHHHPHEHHQLLGINGALQGEQCRELHENSLEEQGKNMSLKLKLISCKAARFASRPCATQSNPVRRFLSVQLAQSSAVWRSIARGGPKLCFWMIQEQITKCQD